MSQKPPYTITSTILKHVASISERLALFATAGALTADALSPQLRRENRIRTIHASLAIENNTLSLEQVCVPYQEPEKAWPYPQDRHKARVLGDSLK